jgi:FkbM family methyltransferase
MMRKIRKYAAACGNLGCSHFLAYLYYQKLRRPKSRSFFLSSKHAGHPLQCRPFPSSGIDVFKHIFVLREYHCLDELSITGLIIDCGANAGFSTAYFLNRFPEATVIAVEPDPGNFELLTRNVAPYGDRCETVKAGVWSKPGGLKFPEVAFGDGREWARSVREVVPGETPDVEAVDIGSLLERSGRARISLLKIDIEGSEETVFSGSHAAWLDRVDHLIIELHGEDCTRLYLEAVGKAGFESRAMGGLTLSTKIR